MSIQRNEKVLTNKNTVEKQKKSHPSLWDLMTDLHLERSSSYACNFNSSVESQSTTILFILEKKIQNIRTES